MHNNAEQYHAPPLTFKLPQILCYVRTGLTLRNIQGTIRLNTVEKRGCMLNSVCA